MADHIEFFVPGIPRPRQSVRFGVSKKGKLCKWQPKDDEPSSWKDRVHAAALQARAEQGSIQGPVSVCFYFVYPPPKNIIKTLKNSGLELVEPGLYVKIFSDDNAKSKPTTPDLDNLEKLAMDAIKDVVIGDDKLVVEKVSSKEWGSPQ